MLVGLSGIDASGKGFIAHKLAAELRRRRLRVALIGVDGWLNLPSVRFGSPEPGRHFYDNALRLDEMFEQLVVPLVRQRNPQARVQAGATVEELIELGGALRGAILRGSLQQYLEP